MNRVKENRLRLFWTQSDLALNAGISRSTIAKIEAGNHDPGDITKAKLAKALNVSVLELFPVVYESLNNKSLIKKGGKKNGSSRT